MTDRRMLELELQALYRARTDWLRWYGGGLDRRFMERTGARMIEVRRQLNELEKESDDN